MILWVRWAICCQDFLLIIILYWWLLKIYLYRTKILLFDWPLVDLHCLQNSVLLLQVNPFFIKELVYTFSIFQLPCYLNLHQNLSYLHPIHLLFPHYHLLLLLYPHPNKIKFNIIKIRGSYIIIIIKIVLLFYLHLHHIYNSNLYFPLDFPRHQYSLKPTKRPNFHF